MNNVETLEKYDINRLIGLLDSNPAELVGLLVDMPKDQNIGVSIVGALPNIFLALQRNGTTLMDGIDICAPLFKCIAESDAFSLLPLKTQPALAFGWWLSNQDLQSEAATHWSSTSTEHCLSHALDWVLFVHSKSNIPKEVLNLELPPLTALLNRVEHQIGVQNLLINKPQSLKLHDDKTAYLESKKNWDAVMSFLSQEQMIRLAPRFSKNTSTGAVLSFIDRIRPMDVQDIQKIVHVLPDGLNCSTVEMIRNKHTIQKPWTAPLAGLYLLSGTGVVKYTPLLGEPTVSQFLNIMGLMGIDAESGSPLRKFLKQQWNPEKVLELNYSDAFTSELN